MSQETSHNLPPKRMRESRAIKASIVLPPDTNNHNTMFGGKVMSYIDDIAAISAMRHCRQRVVTASTDSVDFMHPIRLGDSICLESFVTWTHKTSMEVFVKVTAEDLMTGNRAICATSFLTFVALDPDNRPILVPPVYPESEEEKFLHETASERAKVRHDRRSQSRELAEKFVLKRSWEAL
ncbi:acyl-CoA thioesterase [Tumebacillus permanentifrigoris]|jgi:acyl-CoA hydrolase|uniref:Acyl-CoA hydrolase n=1 Tax=Tumebacillus permanentifrigoris TaxID=378543 RepID=A0A316DB17_9BACL|nr:acyl-CoA thioesterase [Tumebacillus permanentifrigoris]PWK11214.1 acyl-CoA hydrolase [Tumebacillus permanentifrigoris]